MPFYCVIHGTDNRKRFSIQQLYRAVLRHCIQHTVIENNAVYVLSSRIVFAQQPHIGFIRLDQAAADGPGIQAIAGNTVFP